MTTARPHPSGYAAAFLAGLVLASNAAAESGKLTASAGFDYSSGKYGSSANTTILYAPFVAKYEIGSWTAKVILPYLEISSPGTVVGGGTDVVVIGTTQNARRTTSRGMGDVVTALTYSVLEGNPYGLFLDLTAKIKLPTADDQKGLGTGKADHTAVVDVFKSLGRFTLLGSLGYKDTGQPDGLNLNNVWFGGIGGAWRFSSATSGGVLWDVRQPSRDGIDGARDLTVYLTHKWSDTFKMQLYTYRGFSHASADLGGGAMFSLTF